MPRWLKYLLLGFILLLIGSIPLAMQFDMGSIQGVVTNEVGPVVRASVEVRGAMGGSVRRAESDVAGPATMRSRIFARAGTQCGYERRAMTPFGHPRSPWNADR